MKIRTLLLLLTVLLAAGFAVGVLLRPAPASLPRKPAPVRPPSTPKSAPAVPRTSVFTETPQANTPTPTAPRAPLDVRGRMTNFGEEGMDIGKLEEEIEARLLEDPKFAQEIFDAFQAESDPMRMSFLQNVLASNPEIRNNPEWQDRFMKVAETSTDPGRRETALLFVEQAESIRAVRDRLYSLAEHGDVRLQALVALNGLPDHRMPDPQLKETCTRIADTDRDPEVIGVALRIENDPAHAERFLGSTEKEVRMQAAMVVTSVESLQRLLQTEKDPECHDAIEQRINELTNPTPK